MDYAVINRVVITSKGDESVGILSVQWHIDGPIHVEHDDIDVFKKRLSEAWEYVADDADVSVELQAKCLECNKFGAVVQPPDEYSGWCQACARLDSVLNQ